MQPWYEQPWSMCRDGWHCRGPQWMPNVINPLTSPPPRTTEQGAAQWAPQSSLQVLPDLPLLLQERWTEVGTAGPLGAPVLKEGEQGAVHAITHLPVGAGSPVLENRRRAGSVVRKMRSWRIFGEGDQASWPSHRTQCPCSSHELCDGCY